MAFNFIRGIAVGADVSAFGGFYNIPFILLISIMLNA
jgi:hypothetical protein